MSANSLPPPARVAKLRPVAKVMVGEVRRKRETWPLIANRAGFDLKEDDKEAFHHAMRLGARLYRLRWQPWLLDPRSRTREIWFIAALSFLFAGLGVVTAFITKDTMRNVGFLGSPAHGAIAVILLGQAALFFRWYLKRQRGPFSYIYITRHLRRNVPHLLVMDELWDVFNDAEWEHGLAAPDARRLMGRKLVAAAQNLELFVPRCFAVGEVNADALLKSRCREAAVEIRGYASWVALPGERTREDLLDRLSRLLIIVLRAQFDLLPTAARAEGLRRGQRVVMRFVATIKQIFIAVAPFVFIVWILPLFAVVPKSVESWLRVTAAVWMLISIIIPLDPFFSSKLAALRDLNASLRSGAPAESKKNP
ncbi:hypothetical protein J5U46_21600 [Micromonospora tulbaghiae]|uniref:Uncharacterized protein n=1 Tax=Micromonospora tulbaghiae TaxID=479978 RepID=A0AAW4JLT1_9ACTN|nr:hypothetical protein [Micromonospora tulbaghiae]MBO4142747.1 hypothetical protein [Micromonospora tulbaghiae]